MQKRTRQYTVFKNGKIFPIGIFTLKVKTEIIFGVKIQIPISSKQKMGHIFFKKKNRPFSLILKHCKGAGVLH